MRDVAVVVSIDDAGLPKSAKAEGRIERSVADVWKVIEDVNRYADRIPMMSKVRLVGERATVDLKFKVALFSVGFQFVVDIEREREKFLALSWVSGEPRGIKLRFDLEPLDGGAACLLRTSGEFDANSLGWLTKYFLKHHPEIQFGVMPGVAVALFVSMRTAAEGQAR